MVAAGMDGRDPIATGGGRFDHLRMVIAAARQSRGHAERNRLQSGLCSNARVPYRLTDQPEPIAKVLMHIGYDVRMARYGQFESQSRLSERAGIGQSTWSMVENGVAEGVRLETLARIAVALGGELTLGLCRHPPGLEQSAETGRLRHLIGATSIAGTRSLRRGPS